jgi:hypothetical protein
MGAMRVASLSALVLGLSRISTSWAAPPEMSSSPWSVPAETPDDSLPSVGLMLDAGLPDGVIGALAIRPVPYVRLHLGGGGNSASPGVRGGLTILPVGEGPSLNLEVGHYLPGDANRLVRSVFAGLGDFGSYVRRFSYTYFNAHAGLELGRRSFTFFIHGGFTYLRATLHDVQAPIEGDPARPGRTTVTFKRDPFLRMLAPSAKLGLVVYLQ